MNHLNIQPIQTYSRRHENNNDRINNNNNNNYKLLLQVTVLRFSVAVLSETRVTFT